jgi:hypothetical protein
MRKQSIFLFDLDVWKSSHMRAKPKARFTIVVLWNIGLMNDTAAFQASSRREYIENVVRSTGTVRLAMVPEERFEVDNHMWKWSWGVNGRSGSTF